MFEIGRVCVKIAGRDAKQKCVIVKVLDDNYVMIDGATRRRKCNKLHLEPTTKVLSIKEDASTKEVAKAFEELGVVVKETKAKPKTVKPKKVARAKKSETGTDKKKAKTKKAKK